MGCDMRGEDVLVLKLGEGCVGIIGVRWKCKR